MISTILWLLNDMLPLNTDVNVPTVRNKQKTFAGIFKATAKRSRIRARSGSVIQCTDPDPEQNVTDLEHSVYDWQGRIPSLNRWRSDLPIRGPELV
jgi:hypothetical protein